jgi:hypothetical protein
MQEPGGGEREELLRQSRLECACELHVSHGRDIYGSRHGCGGRCYHRRQNGAFLSGGTGRRWLAPGFVVCACEQGREGRTRQTGAPLSGHAGSTAVCLLRFSHYPCAYMIWLHPSPARYPRATGKAFRALGKAARKATDGRRHQASLAVWARTAGRTQPVRDRLNQQPPLYCRVRC